MRGHLWHNTRPQPLLPPRHGCVDDLITVCSFDSQATWVIDVLGLIFDMLSMGACKTSTGSRRVEWCRNYMSVL